MIHLKPYSKNESVLRHYNESSDFDNIEKDINDIFQELKDDYFSIKINDSLKTFNEYIIVSISKNKFHSSEISEDRERLIDYMKSIGWNHISTNAYGSSAEGRYFSPKIKNFSDPYTWSCYGGSGLNKVDIVFKKYKTVNESKINKNIQSDIKDILLELTDDKVLQYQSNMYKIGDFTIYCGNSSLLSPNQSVLVYGWFEDVFAKEMIPRIKNVKSEYNSFMKKLKLGDLSIEIYQTPTDPPNSEYGPFEIKEVQEIIDRIRSYMTDHGYKTKLKNYHDVGYTQLDPINNPHYYGGWVEYMIRLTFEK